MEWFKPSDGVTPVHISTNSNTSITDSYTPTESGNLDCQTNTNSNGSIKKYDNIYVSANTPPFISANGTTLTLGCNPSSTDINGALGTATATDACGTPSVTSSDGTCSEYRLLSFSNKNIHCYGYGWGNINNIKNSDLDFGYTGTHIDKLVEQQQHLDAIHQQEI
jgi:hypothetical protein